jgi:hypothetical protein
MRICHDLNPVSAQDGGAGAWVAPVGFRAVDHGLGLGGFDRAVAAGAPRELADGVKDLQPWQSDLISPGE